MVATIHIVDGGCAQNSPPDVHQASYSGDGASPAATEALAPEAAFAPNRHHPSSTLSTPADIPSALLQRQQQGTQPQHTDTSASPSSLSPDGTPQQPSPLHSTGGAGLPAGMVRHCFSKNALKAHS